MHFVTTILPVLWIALGAAPALAADDIDVVAEELERVTGQDRDGLAHELRTRLILEARKNSKG